jgi:hypothetical protein
MEALPGAAPIRDRDGGTAYVIFRKDCMRCLAGVGRLEARKIRERSPTNRVVATCCNSAMYLNFDDGKHWVDIYRPRIEGGLPPIQMRVCTKFIAEGVPLSSDAPNCSGRSAKSRSPARLIRRLREHRRDSRTESFCPTDLLP